MSSRKRSLSCNDNYETSCERKKQKKSERDASTVVDVSPEDDKSASIREKLRSKLLKNNGNLMKTTLTLRQWSHVEENF